MLTCYSLCRPTHFVAVQVSHEPHVIEAIEKVQTSLVSHTAGLREALVDSVTAHMTLMVMPELYSGKYLSLPFTTCWCPASCKSCCPVECAIAQMQHEGHA